MKKLIYISLFFLCFSCGYKFQIVNLADDVKTVQVIPFSNSASLVNPNLTQILTLALLDKFQKNTKLETTNGVGDIVFEGNITGYEVRPVSIGASSAAQSRLTITVGVTYTNTKEEDKDFQRSFSQFADFTADADFSTVENQLIDEIQELLINEIFNAAVADW